ncbi:TIGR01777 family oxidoreductase [Marinospirillum perlucidum]|uniref:TIGR01777 family oxidoreductase n=1 Tax=Marinospirillum perlucidum TaxID=1982602 RepID=UPI000DF28E93|nr:TIGR01777 family oxidoreductase [Marinospirillum perlucidum]
MQILISGGTGFIGRELVPLLAGAGHQPWILTRQHKPDLPQGTAGYVRDLDQLPDQHFDAVINLAGAGIADQRWTEKRKAELVSSRVEVTRKLVEWMQRQEKPPEVLVSASAVGYYGEQGDQEVTETTPPTAGFAHDLCVAWEAEALKAEDLGVRVCLVRTGVVLAPGGGSLGKMLPAFKLGLGGPLGKGQHWFPWIHREDMARIYRWLVEESSAHGVYNASAPQPVTNKEFTRTLATTLKRPAFMPMPEPLLKVLFGEMAELLLVSDRMLPQRLQEEGFEFNYPQLEGALRHLLK